MSAPASDPQADAALARAAAVRLMAFDVDGTLTDGGIHISAQGEAHKRFSVRDGLGLVLLRDNGIRVAIVTGRSSAIVEQRARELGIEEVIQGVADKSQVMRGLAERHRLQLDQCGFMGDDWPDLPAMRVVGFAAAVQDAAPAVREAAHWCAHAAGGHGAARELAEYLLHAQGRMDAALGRFDGRRA
jgi:3-deoxy-D-manno-octulosonate 8-phosphate phosphatase (KDO 8-P phosphatase)